MSIRLVFVFTVLLPALVLATGCERKDDTKVATQVAARVNADEITVHQVNDILAWGQNITPEGAAQAKREILDRLIDQQLKKQNFVFLDYLKEGAEGKTLETRRKHYYDSFRALKPGVTEFIVHLSLDDAEIRNITGNWEARWNEYQIMTDPRTRVLLNELGIKLIGYRELSRLAFKPE